MVNPVEHADVSRRISFRIASLGSLVIGHPPPHPGYAEEAEATVHSGLDHKDYLHYLNVIDLENDGEIIVYAKWEMYLHGQLDLEKLRKLMNQSDREVDGLSVLREAANAYFCSRNMVMGQHPHARRLMELRRPSGAIQRHCFPSSTLIRRNCTRCFTCHVQ